MRRWTIILACRGGGASGPARRGWGTLSEIALAMKARRPVVALGSWPLEGVPTAATAAEAVDQALAAAR